jgi:S-disulfanyl-L-cysteine oxidoreductase SoxD
MPDYEVRDRRSEVIRWAFGLLCGVAITACQVADRGESAPATYGLGTPATAAQIAALNSDVSPSGEGLPAGSGNATRGAELFATQCASCHGAKGEGAPGNPPGPMLVGREPREGFPFGNDPKLVRTVGNYWPQATTIFDYIRRTMPLSSPGSLTDDEIYSLTAFLLVANEILPAGASLDSASLMAVRMPARDRFVPDNRRGGAEVK